MFERFTDKARRVVVLAQEEARMLQHDYIGTEHLLLGLARERRGVAAKVLESLGIAEKTLRQQVEETVGRGKHAPSGHIPFTPRAKKSLELSLREAIGLGHNYIGTEHILLGVVRAAEGPAAQILAGLGASLDTVRERVTELLAGHQAERAAAEGQDAPGPRRGGQHALPSEVLGRLGRIEARLAVLEQRVGTGPDVSDLDRQIAQARRDKETAIEAQDFENAAVLRDTERGLLEEKAARHEQWAATHPGLASLSDEVARLRDLLREHGIDPQDGAA